MTTYYTYIHERLDNNQPFYVGKGTGRRAWSTSRRNKHWNNIAKKGFNVKVVFETDCELEAFKKEAELIKLYRPTLVNYRHELGDGNFRHSEETKLTLRTYVGPKNHFYGKKHTKEANLKNRLAHIGCKVPGSKHRKVECVETSIIYNSLSEAARAISGNKSNIARSVKMKIKAYKFTWRYV